MAQWNHPATRRPPRYLAARPGPDPAGPTTEPDSAEFDEADVWGDGSDEAGRVDSPSDPDGPRRRGRRQKRAVDRVSYPRSLPVTVPLWGKREGTDGGDEAGRGWVEGCDVDSPCGEVTGFGFVPPHEMLRRCRAASFSVQEGLGRTLKGRDLSRVRNAVWAKIGFED